MIDDIYKNLFGEEAAAVAVANGRVNLIGEHLDYNGGMVLPTAIEKKVSIAIGPGAPDKDEIISASFDDRIKRPVHDKRTGHWSDYVAGALAKARASSLIEEGVQVVVDSDIPHGAGLSSSAAVVVATLKAASMLADHEIDNVEIALWAQAVEHDFIGVPCGIMDQMAVAIATHGEALALDTKTLRHDLIRLPDSHHFAVMHSGVTRKLEDGRYADRRRECEAARDALSVDYLCLMTPEKAAEIDSIPPVLARRARHAYSEHQRVLAGVDALRAGDVETFGALMDESHASMRDDFEITTPEIDAVVKGARECGAVGARMTGGGFGGCIVACVPAADTLAWCKKMEATFEKAVYVS
jgi:galactokinase